jgi:hypothetical protein
MRRSDRKALVRDFTAGFGGGPYHSEQAIIIPQIDYLTNDSWEDASAIDGWMGWPMLHSADYSKGKLIVLTIPDNKADLYELPIELLNRIRQSLAKDMFVRLEGAAKVSLFAYDNRTFIVESFRDEAVNIGLVVKGKRLTDLQTGEALAGDAIPAPTSAFARAWLPSDEGKSRVKLTLKPHSFRAFRVE